MLVGFNNRVAWVDLTQGTVEYKPIDEVDARKYIGARGLGVKYVFDNGPKVDPLSPDNILCFMTGPLTGTDVNLSGRISVVTKSPLTGTVTDSHHGGWSGARLKWAGLDGIVFKGKAPKPTYVVRRKGAGHAERRLGAVGQGRARYHQDPAGRVRRQGRPERHRHRPGGRAAGQIRQLDQRTRPRLRPGRHRLRGRQQEPQGGRDPGQPRRPAAAGRQGRHSRRPKRPPWPSSWTSAWSRRPAKAGCRSTAPTS